MSTNTHTRESCRVITDVGQATAECIRLGNKLVSGLHLNMTTPYTITREILAAHLVEIHCRLLGLSFPEYTPVPQPSKAVEDILLSLRDKFGGAHNFDHLDSLLISTGEPTHLLCLLEIFDAMYEHYLSKGQTFSNPALHDDTILTNSDNGAESPMSGAADVSEQKELLFRITVDLNVEDEKNKQFEPDSSDAEGGWNENYSRRSSIKSRREIRGNDRQERILSKPEARRNAQKTEAARRKKSRASSKSTTNTARTAEPIRAGPPMPLKRIEENNRSRPSTAQPSRTSTPKQFQYSQIEGRQTSISPPQGSLGESEVFDHSLTNSPNGLQLQFEKHFQESNKDPIRQGSQQSSMRNERTSSDEPDIRVNIHIEDSQFQNSNESDALSQLNVIHDEIQHHIRKQLSKMEEQIGSVKDDNICATSRTKVGRQIRARPKSAPYPNCKPGTKFDYFGNPIYERFPYYARGLIVPRCHSPPPLKCRQPDSYDGLYELISKLCKERLNGDSNQEIGSRKFHSQVPRNSRIATQDPSTLCVKILTRVLTEFPNCKLDSQSFELLNKKCEDYVKLLDTNDVNEQDIRKKVELKIREFVSSNCALTRIEKKLSDAEDRRKIQMQTKSLTKSVAVKRSTERQMYSVAKKNEQAVRSEMLKLIEAKRAESQHIINAFDQALQFEKKSAMRLRKDKKDRAEKIFLEADKELIKLQESYTTQMAVFRQEAERLKHEFGPDAEKRLKRVWTTCRLTIQTEIDKCVDKIIQEIATIYSKP